MPSALENLVGVNGPLIAEPPDAKEIEGLIQSGRARLPDAKIAALALESRFDLAYNAAHAFCLAALRRKGYRAKHRYIVSRCCRIPSALALKSGGYEILRVLLASMTWAAEGSAIDARLE